MPVVYLGLGTNMGQREDHLRAALQALAMLPELSLTGISSIYETEPIGPEQDRFLNMAVRVETAMPPRELLAVCQAIEEQLGRVRESFWGPRVIDIDILLYEGEVMDEPDLALPHREMRERAFVLLPLVELDADLRLPSGEKLLERLSLLDMRGVRLYMKIPQEELWDM